MMWLRLYWIYLNTIVFFAPFDNIGLFSIDILAFLSGAFGLLSTGHSPVWFFTLAIVLFVCLTRIHITISKAGDLSSEYPRSSERLKMSLPKFRNSLLIPMFSGIVFGFGAAFSDSECVEVSVTFACMLICLIISSRHIDPFYPVKEDFLDHTS